MNKKRMSLLSLLALIILVAAQDAAAEIRVNATLHTPHMSVGIGNIPCGRHPRYAPAPLPIRGRRLRMVYRHDRAIARRLARYTGVPARRLIRLRRFGYTWFEIGRWLDLPRRVVSAAMHQRSWNRFLHRRLRHARRGIRRGRGRRIGYYEND
jgi:hypothetical protein